MAPSLSLGSSAFDLPAAMRESFSALLLLDVLEHLPEPTEFLRRCEQAFPNARHVLVTVPARMEIWSNYDEYNGHFRRYTLETIARVADGTSLALRDSGYFFHALYAAARALSATTKQRETRLSAPGCPSCTPPWPGCSTLKRL